MYRIVENFCIHKFLQIYELLVKTKFLQFISLRIGFFNSATPLTPLLSNDSTPCDMCATLQIFAYRNFSGHKFLQKSQTFVPGKISHYKYVKKDHCRMNAMEPEVWSRKKGVMLEGAAFTSIWIYN